MLRTDNPQLSFATRYVHVQRMMVASEEDRVFSYSCVAELHHGTRPSCPIFVPFLLGPRDEDESNEGVHFQTHGMQRQVEYTQGVPFVTLQDSQYGARIYCYTVRTDVLPYSKKRDRLLVLVLTVA